MCLGFLCLSADSTAAIIVKMGPFSLDDPKDYSVDVRISDGGRPIQASVTKLAIKVGSAAAWSEKKNTRIQADELRGCDHTHITHF